MLEILRKEKFSIFLTILTVAICVVSFLADIFSTEAIYWFQRSGALIVLAGVELQYSRLNSVHIPATIYYTIPSSVLDPDIQQFQKENYGISDIEKTSLDIAANSQEIATETSALVTKKMLKDSIAILLIVIGTAIWAYGDLPFKNHVYDDKIKSSPAAPHSPNSAPPSAKTR